MRGAAIRGLMGLRPSKRLARRHYGYSISFPFREGIDDQEYSWIDDWSGDKWCRNRMEWFINKVAVESLVCHLWMIANHDSATLSTHIPKRLFLSGKRTIPTVRTSLALSTSGIATVTLLLTRRDIGQCRKWAKFLQSSRKQISTEGFQSGVPRDIRQCIGLIMTSR